MFFYLAIVVAVLFGGYMVSILVFDRWMGAETVIGQFVGTVVVFPIATAVAGLVLIGVTLGGAHIDGTKTEYSHTINLQAINMGNKIDGRSYFLSGGYIEQSMVYRFYVKSDDGTFYPDYVYASDVTIVESDEGEPHIDVWNENMKGLYFPDSAPVFGDALKVMGHEYVITVPKGSITSEINMDLPND